MLRRTAMKRTTRSTGPTAEVVDAVLGRANHSCEICDDGIGHIRGVDWSIHHRHPRGQGGTSWRGVNLPSNLMLVCGSGTTGCHGEIESRRSDAVIAGWLVPRGTDPAKVSVLVNNGDRWVYLTDDAQYSDAPPEAAA